MKPETAKKNWNIAASRHYWDSKSTVNGYFYGMRDSECPPPKTPPLQDTGRSRLDSLTRVEGLERRLDEGNPSASRRGQARAQRSPRPGRCNTAKHLGYTCTTTTTTTTKLTTIVTIESNAALAKVPLPPGGTQPSTPARDYFCTSVAH